MGSGVFSQHIFKMLLFLSLNIPMENCMLIRRYDGFFWVIQFSPLLLQPRYRIIPFMYWSNSFLQLFRDLFFFLVPILPFGGSFSIRVSFPLKYVHGLLILLCAWASMAFSAQCWLPQSMEQSCSLSSCARLKKQNSCPIEFSSGEDS